MTREPLDLTEAELTEVARFVRLVENLTVEALAAVDIDSLPRRDRTYVRRLRILAIEDASLIQRQRIVWLKLRHGIRLLEGEARELLEVLGCRGFYFSGLNLDGMAFTTLDLSGGVIRGDYSSNYTSILGLCDERGLVVVGRYLSHHRVEGELAADGLRVLEHASLTQAPGLRDSGCTGEGSPPSETRRDGAQSLDTESETDGIEELLDDDIIEWHGPPSAPAVPRRSGRSLFPPSVPAFSPGPAARRYSLAPPRAGSSRSSPPPRASVPPRSLRATLRPFGAPATPRIRRGGRGTSIDTTEIDTAWE